MPTRPMRRSDRQTSDAEARELLARAEYGVLSVVGADGEPYGVPVSFAFCENQLVFHCAPEGRKLECLAEHARASFCVVGRTEVLPARFSTRYESAIVEGTVRELAGDEKRLALRWLIEKYSSGFLAEGDAYIAAAESKTRVFALSIASLTGKARR